MALALKSSGIDVAIHPTDSGCGDPCHPSHPCESCEPFWRQMQATGRFHAYVPPTFAGEAPPQARNFTADKVDFSSLSFRSKGSNS